jgi:hypothetical protein
MKKLTQEQNEKVQELINEVVSEATEIIRQNEKIVKRVSKDRLDASRNQETTLTMMNEVIFTIINNKVDCKKETDIHTALENSNIQIAKKIHELI